MRLRAAVLALALLPSAVAACLSTQKQPPKPPGLDAGGSGIDGGPISCRPCLSDDDCSAKGACLQFAGNDFCAVRCPNLTECTDAETCVMVVLSDGTPGQVCIPKSGSCGDNGCGTCAQGTYCEWTLGMCLPVPDDSRCGTLIGPSYSACCRCSNSGCSLNGCYGGWWCDTASCRCAAPPLGCATGDAGIPVEDAGVPQGSVGPDGGSVSRLYFAVVGDTRPGRVDDTQGYPTAIITRIFQDIQGMVPRPQFVLATGDFVYADPANGQAAPQLDLYATASRQFLGPVFPVLGNHECTGYTADNCSGVANANLAAYKSALLSPLGMTSDYFTIPFTALDGSWTAKLIILACNDWDPDQQSWFIAELAKPTTYTLVARHEPSSATSAPCVKASDGILAASPYNLLLVGHTHSFARFDKQVIVGISGAPLSGGGTYGYATVEQLSTGFVIRQYDWSTALPVSAAFVPFN